MKKHPVKQTTERRVSATLRIAMAVILLLLNIGSVILLTFFLQVHAAIAFAILEIIAIAVAVNIQSSPVSASYKLAWTLLVVALPGRRSENHRNRYRPDPAACIPLQWWRQAAPKEAGCY